MSNIISEINEKLGVGFFDYSTEMPDNLTNINYVLSDNPVEYGFGHTTRNIFVKDNNTEKIYDPRRLKALFIDGQYKDHVSRHYTVIPDQKIEMLMEPLTHEHNLKPLTKEKTSNGLGTCWRMVSDKTFQIKRTENKDDIYNVGVMVRNSVNGGIALGMNVDTYRQVCSNGMMGWRPELAIRIAHYGNVDMKLKEFSRRFDQALALYEQIEDTLQKTVEIPVTNELAQFFVTESTLPRNWLPDWIHTDEKYRVTGLGGGGNHMLYEAINDVTWKLTRSRKDHPEHRLVNGELGFLQRTGFEKSLGRTVEMVVKANGGVPSSRRKGRNA
jgi:hypothetical protein